MHRHSPAHIRLVSCFMLNSTHSESASTWRSLCVWWERAVLSSQAAAYTVAFAQCGDVRLSKEHAADKCRDLVPSGKLPLCRAAGSRKPRVLKTQLPARESRAVAGSRGRLENHRRSKRKKRGSQTRTTGPDRLRSRRPRAVGSGTRISLRYAEGRKRNHWDPWGLDHSPGGVGVPLGEGRGQGGRGLAVLSLSRWLRHAPA